MSEKDFSEADFDEFVRQFSEYLDAANESKKLGNNDYNPLKAVQNPNDEVNMHSGFLVSLLDTRGEHYQDDLFLKLFLQTLGLENWFGETKNAQVLKEKKNIDIHINNGEKHIIIENKIWSGDQDEQIARYIKEIHGNSSDDESVSYENIAVVYLSPFGREPSPNSLCLKNKNIKWQIKGDLLAFNENKVKYKQISYEKDILAWIEKCQKEVGNITSLNSALEFYKDIVEIITDKKESKMNIAGFFKEQKDFEIAFEICKNEDEIMNAYLKNIADDIRKGVSDGWEVVYTKYDECGNLFVFDGQYRDKIALSFSIERNKKWFECWFYLEYNDNNITQRNKEAIKKYLSQELKKRELTIFYEKRYDLSYIDYLKIDEPLTAKKVFLDFINKRIDLANQLNAKLKEFKA